MHTITQCKLYGASCADRRLLVPVCIHYRRPTFPYIRQHLNSLQLIFFTTFFLDIVLLQILSIMSFRPVLESIEKPSDDDDKQHITSSNASNNPPVSDDDDEDMDEDIAADDRPQYILIPSDDEDEDDDALVCLGKQSNDARSSPKPLDSKRITSAPTKMGFNVTERMAIDIKAPGEDLFFYIREIWSYEDKIFLSGWSMQRLSSISYFDDKPNEVAIIVTLIDDDEEADVARSFTTISLPEKFEKVDLIFTNKIYPAIGTTAKELAGLGRSGVEDEKSAQWRADHDHQLVCRWFFTEVITSKCKLKGLVFRRLMERELRILSPLPASDARLRRAWLRRTCPTYTPQGQSAFYTFGDVFCGGGGAVSGAHQAGFKVSYVVDNNRDAIHSNQLNMRNQSTKFRLQDASDFCVGEPRIWKLVDLCHLSPPCPAFSHANTTDPDLDRNVDIAALSSILPQLLLLSRPRLVTLENVPGLFESFDATAYLQMIINAFLSYSFSLRLTVEDLRRFGNPSRRRRMMIVAACPGEELPAPLPFTHGPGTGQDFVTISRALRPLAGHLVPDNMSARPTPRVQPSAALLSQLSKPDESFRRCILTLGAGLHHGGKRFYSAAETALLNGFPVDYRFSGGRTAILKQIGNAVPPCFYAQLASHLRRHLERSDAAAPPHEFIDLTD